MPGMESAVPIRPGKRHAARVAGSKTLLLPCRDMTQPVRGIAHSDPTASASSVNPRSPGPMPKWAWTSGIRGAQVPSRRPLSVKATATPMYATLTWSKGRAGEGSRTPTVSPGASDIALLRYRQISKGQLVEAADPAAAGQTDLRAVIDSCDGQSGGGCRVHSRLRVLKGMRDDRIHVQGPARCEVDIGRRLGRQPTTRADDCMETIPHPRPCQQPFQQGIWGV